MSASAFARRAAPPILALALGACQGAPPQAWTADLGNGQYRNPILHAGYADPDLIRVGANYYMTSSSFSNTPGLPLLQSRDMVNWELVGHALPRLVPEQVCATPQPGRFQ